MKRTLNLSLDNNWGMKGRTDRNLEGITFKTKGFVQGIETETILKRKMRRTKEISGRERGVKRR